MVVMPCSLAFAGKCGVRVFEPVAAAFEGDDFGVVHDPVDNEEAIFSPHL